MLTRKKHLSFLSSVLVILLILPFFASIANAETEPITITRSLGTKEVFEYNSGVSLGSNYSIMVGKDKYLKTKITVPETGIYSFNLNYTSTGDGFGISITADDNVIADNETIFRDPANTGGSIGTAYAKEQSFGNVLLTAGEHIITLTTPTRNGSSMIAVRTITLVKQEIPFETIVQPLNNTTEAETNLTSDYISAKHYLMMSNKYVSVPVTTYEAGTYDFILKHVTPGVGLKVSVAVNGEVQLDNVVLTKHPDNNGVYDDTYVVEECIGQITLPFGKSIITISTPTTNGGSGVRAMQFTIDTPKAEDETEAPTAEPTEEPTEAPTAEPTNVPVLSGNAPLEIVLNSTNKNISNDGTAASINASYSQLGGGSSVSVPVNAETAGDYSITFKNLVAGPNLRFSVGVDGVTQITNAIIEHGGNTSYNSAYIRYQKLGNITLKQGLNYINLMAYKGNGGTPIMAHSITLQKPQEMELVNFALNNASGGRMIYGTREGLEAKADVTLKKHGAVAPYYMLACVAYDESGRLSSINTFDIDCSEMADGETKAFSSLITLNGNEKGVKAMLIDKLTQKPLTSSKEVSTLSIIENVDELLSSEVSYQLATETLNNDGVAYGEYGLHTDSYDIDAIFYDGYNDTKVFAYIGYPKTASETNKVPAMVLLHGGLGKAERYWVEKWNKLGFAAIAMDLYGRGPENDSSTSSGKKQHPYAGVNPYAVPGSFLSDIENAGMYQNIVAVINAHNILRDSGKVDTSNVGITGISWGGVTTTTVIGVDDRFKFAAPVYGCGFLDQSKTYFSSAYSDSTATILWDPANFAAKADIPVLYVNGDTDANFSVDATSLTKGITKNARMSIIHDFAHDQPHGDSVELVYAFAQSMVKDTDPFITIKNESIENGTFTAGLDIPEGTEVASAVMYYITSEKLSFGGGKDTIGWQTSAEYTLNDGTLEMAVPGDATHAYVSVTDQNGYIISSEFIKIK